MPMTGMHHTKEFKEKMKDNNYHWKGGFTKDNEGYILFKTPKGCRFSCMANKQRYTKVSRLMMSAYLGRPLTSEEVTHHINGIRDDDRIENLRLFDNQSEHIAHHHKLGGYIR